MDCDGHEPGRSGPLLDMKTWKDRVCRNIGRGCFGGGACVLYWVVSLGLVPLVSQVFVRKEQLRFWPGMFCEMEDTGYGLRYTL